MTSRRMATTVEQIKDRLSITDVVGNYLKLNKAGRNYKAKCPFHNEKTPSFFVSPERGNFYCFGCHKGGDIFNFIEEIEGCDFPAALRILAEQAGVKIEEHQPSDSSGKEEIFSVLEEAAVFFQRELLKSSRVKEYLTQRGLNEDSIRRFRLGYVSNEWQSAYNYLTSKGYQSSIIERAGLIIRREAAGYYDRFRGRIIFPISNGSGKIVGFSGRILPEFQKENESGAKYINSPDTEVFNKSRLLYGYDKAKMAMRTANACILVEGQMDLILSHQAGMANTVALSGTALTGEHLSLIKRLANKIIMAFDSDSAGFRASERSVHLALQDGLEVNITSLPVGKDPAELIAEKPSLWHDTLQGAAHVIDFYLNAFKDDKGDVRELGGKVKEKILPFVASLASEIDKAHFIGKIAQNLRIGEEPLWRELKKITAADYKEGTGAEENSPLGHIHPAADGVNMALRRLRGILLWQKESKEKILSSNQLVVIDNFLKPFLSNQSAAFDKTALIYEAEKMYGGADNLYNKCGNLMESLKKSVLKEEFRETIEKLKKAEEKSDQKEVTKLLKECQLIAGKLNDLKDKEL